MMPFSKYKVTKKFKDATKLSNKDIPGLAENVIDANRNNIAILEFVNDSNPADLHTYFAKADDLSNAVIEAQARSIIFSLNAQEKALTDVTVGVEKTPATVGPDPKQADLKAAQAAFAKAQRAAFAKSFGDPATTDALAALEAAEDALK